MDKNMNTDITAFSEKITLPDSKMALVYAKKDGPGIVAVWGKDEGTKERKLMLSLMYRDGEVSPIHEYAPSKLTSAKALSDLANMDGVDCKDIGAIYGAIQEAMPNLEVQRMGDKKCSIRYAHRELTKYVHQFMEPDKVFIDKNNDGYGNILATYLPTVIDKLCLGYTRLELQKNFRAWGLLRVNNGTGHPYSYKIVTPTANDWFFSFKLCDEVEGGEAE